MKKILSMFLALTIVLTMVGTMGMVTVSAAGRTITDDFNGDSYVLPYEGNLGHQTSFSNMTDKTERDANGDKMVGGNNVKGLFTLPDEAKVGTVTVSFDVQAKTNTTMLGSVCSVVNGTYSSNTEIVPINLKGTGDNKYCVYTLDDSENEVVLIEAEKMQWDTISYSVDMEKKNYTVTDKDGAKHTIGFKSEAKPNGLYISSKNNVWIAVDNLTIQTTVDEVTKYSVTFVDYDGTVLWQGEVIDGEGATAPTVAERPGYEFKGWDKSFDVITEDTVVTAVYEQAVYFYQEDFNSVTGVTDNAPQGLTSAIDMWASKDNFSTNGPNNQKTKKWNTLWNSAATLWAAVPLTAKNLNVKFDILSANAIDGYVASITSVDKTDLAVSADVTDEDILVPIRMEATGATARTIYTLDNSGERVVIATVSNGSFATISYDVNIEEGTYTVQPSDGSAPVTIKFKNNGTREDVKGIIVARNASTTISGANGGGNPVRFDNLIVTGMGALAPEIVAPAIPDEVTEATDAQGETRTLTNETVNIASEGLLKNATINIGEGKVIIGEKEITGGTIVFGEDGNYDVALNSTLKIKEGTQQSFLNRTMISADEYTITLVANGSGYTNREHNVLFNLGDIFEGNAQFTIEVTEVPDGVEITRK